MHSDWKIKKVDQFVIVNKKLGEGQFGTVYRGYYRDDPSKQVAVKTIPLLVVQKSETLQQHIQREIQILTMIDHPNIVKLIHVTKTSSNLYMILEYCKDGDLAQYLQTKTDQRLSELEAVIFFKHVVSGFMKLFDEKVIHRDIKPSNILLHNGMAKIADFGFARVIESEIDMMVLSRVGSPIYMAPQILEGKHFTSKCDIWSLGVMFYELLYGVTPWMAPGQYELLKKIQSQPLTFPEVPVRSQKVKSLLQQMLQVSEEERISWEQLFNHQIIGIDENDITFNMEQIQKEKDKLMRSVSLNRIYMKQNLIIGYIRNEQQDNVKEDEQTQQQPTNTDIFQHYELESNEAKIVQIINQQCKHERNLAFFYSYVIQHIIGLVSNQLSFSQELTFQLLFLISKNHLIQMQNLHRELTKASSKENDIYRKSREYQQVSRQLQQDIESSMKFFIEILRKCLSLQNKAKQIVLQEQTQEEYDKYVSLLDNNLVETEAFIQEYSRVIQLVLKLIAKDEEKNKSLEILKIKYYLLICKNPKSVFSNYSYDFSKFYEEQQYITQAQLVNCINNLNNINKL